VRYLTRRLFSVLLPAALSACATGPGGGAVPPDAAQAFCQAGDYRFHTDFATAALHGCASSETGPALTVAPEYAPINPSPWYAWRVTGPRTSALTVTQRYLHGRHRYDPWVSEDGENWRRLPESRFEVGAAGELTLRLEVPRGGLYVAAQQPLDNADMDGWARSLAARHGLHSRRAAVSVGGRAVTAWWSDADQRRGLVVLVGRQHPPEVTGGLAYQDFVARLFADDDLARRFRAQWAIGLVPSVNPDGVARGHWRTNQRGVDLNRDWGPFTQPETRGVAAWMKDLHERAPLRLFLDFHSTWSDVFYMPHPADDPVPSGFSGAWRQRLSERLGEAMPGWSGQHNPGLPTAKSWVRKAYGVVGMTYEVGDRTPRGQIRTTAVAAAEEMMKLMLAIEEPSP
jgi:hypothetical protein